MTLASTCLSAVCSATIPKTKNSKKNSKKKLFGIRILDFAAKFDFDHYHLCSASSRCSATSMTVSSSVILISQGIERTSCQIGSPRKSKSSHPEKIKINRLSLQHLNSVATNCFPSAGYSHNDWTEEKSRH